MAIEPGLLPEYDFGDFPDLKRIGRSADPVLLTTSSLSATVMGWYENSLNRKKLSQLSAEGSE